MYYREDRQNEETDLARPVSVLNAAAGFDVCVLYGLASCDLLLLAVYAYALLRGEKAGA